jgi:hypothetical protein
VPDFALSIEACPLVALADPLVLEALAAFSRLRSFDGALLVAGGVDDQDAWLIRAVSVLRQTAEEVQALLQAERLEQTRRR